MPRNAPRFTSAGRSRCALTLREITRRSHLWVVPGARAEAVAVDLSTALSGRSGPPPHGPGSPIAPVRSASEEVCSSAVRGRESGPAEAGFGDRILKDRSPNIPTYQLRQGHRFGIEFEQLPAVGVTALSMREESTLRCRSRRDVIVATVAKSHLVRHGPV